MVDILAELADTTTTPCPELGQDIIEDLRLGELLSGKGKDEAEVEVSEVHRDDHIGSEL